MQVSGANGRLAGRRVLVTGVSAGIGRSIVETFVLEGARVAGIARDNDRLQGLGGALGDGFLPLVCDVADAEGMIRSADQAAASFGGLDCVVVNAGVSDASLLSSGNPEDWRRVIETNLFGAMVTVRSTLRYFGDTGLRDMVIIGSLGSSVAHPTWPAYASSKAGLAMMTECLRQELVPRDIRVSLIEFAQVATEIRERSSVQAGVIQTSPLTILPELFERMDPREITAMVVFAVTRPAGVHLNHMLARPSGCVS